jgi:hypothetical protein
VLPGPIAALPAPSCLPFHVGQYKEMEAETTRESTYGRMKVLRRMEGLGSALDERFEEQQCAQKEQSL